MAAPADCRASVNPNTIDYSGGGHSSGVIAIKPSRIAQTNIVTSTIAFDMYGSVGQSARFRRSRRLRGVRNLMSSHFERD